jgi:hypothetical protein
MVSIWRAKGRSGTRRRRSLKRRPPARQLSRQKEPCPHPPPPPAPNGAGFSRYIAAAVSTPRKHKNDDPRTLSTRRRRRDAARGLHLASTRWRYAASLSLSDGRGRPERGQGPRRRCARLACPKPLKNTSQLCIMRLALRPRLSLCHRRRKTGPHAGVRVGQFSAAVSEGWAGVSGLAYRRRSLRARKPQPRVPSALFADFNPIEMLFAKLKTLSRKAAERTIASPWATIGRPLDDFSADECSRYLAHAGYGSI